ncbi:hypothetical protein, partial [Streptomyces scopuliridis]|uniref:hypothetical protein n=1 Tax=Streptomyces scopuliridis TaxID=452529 RepID=UPI0019D188D5
MTGRLRSSLAIGHVPGPREPLCPHHPPLRPRLSPRGPRATERTPGRIMGRTERSRTGPRRSP